jgi:rhomboid protease GluP
LGPEPITVLLPVSQSCNVGFAPSTAMASILPYGEGVAEARVLRTGPNVFVFLAVTGIAALVLYRGTTPAQRQQFLADVIQPAAARLDVIIEAAAPFRAELRARTPRLIVTPVLVGLNALVFLAMVVGDGSFDSHATLIGWGANHGPRTTNGEWWRLLTALFVQGGTVHFVFILIGLVQVAELAERWVGGPLVAAVYLVAGTFGSIVSLLDHPLDVHVGGSAAVYGLFGLLLAIMGWSSVRPTGRVIPLPVYQLLAPAAVLFFLYASVVDDIGNRPNLTGLVVGSVAGVATFAVAGERKITAKFYGIGVAVATALLLYVAWPLRGTTDVRAELVEVVTNEDRQARVFRLVMEQFNARRVPIDRPRVAALIERTFTPQLTRTRRRVEQLRVTLSEQQPLVLAAIEYVRLREQSWRLRADGLRSGRAAVLRDADRTERAALAALEKLRTIQPTFPIHL